MAITSASATIYDFPTQKREASTANQSTSAAIIDLSARRIYEVAQGKGWYHDDAIRDAQHD